MTLFEPEVREASWKKREKACVTWSLLFRSVHWGKNLVLKAFEVWFRTLFKKLKKILASIWLFSTKLVFNKTLKRKKKFADNQFHNILRFLDVLTNFLFATSEEMGDYQL